MENVYIRFGAWNNLKSKVIRWVTRSKWSHVWIEYDSKRWGGRMVVHADAKGVIIEPLLNFLERRGAPTSTAIYKVNKGNPDSAFIESRYYLGKDYGFRTVILNALLLLLVRLGWQGKGAFRDSGKYVCSEFATLFIKHAEIDCPLDPEATWPGKLADWMETRPDTFHCTVKGKFLQK